MSQGGNVFDNQQNMTELVDSRHAGDRRHAAERRLAGGIPRRRRPLRRRGRWTSRFGAVRITRRDRPFRPAEHAAA